MENNLIPETSTLPEAPASFNVKLKSPQGFSCTLTLRGTNGRELLQRVESALAHLISRGYQPDTYSNNPHKANNGSNGSKPCPIHNVEMRKFEKDGRSWFSHKLEEGGWCKGKPQSKGGSHE